MLHINMFSKLVVDTLLDKTSKTSLNQNVILLQINLFKASVVLCFSHSWGVFLVWYPALEIRRPNEDLDTGNNIFILQIFLLQNWKIINIFLKVIEGKKKNN